MGALWIRADRRFLAGFFLCTPLVATGRSMSGSDMQRSFPGVVPTPVEFWQGFSSLVHSICNGSVDQWSPTWHANVRPAHWHCSPLHTSGCASELIMQWVSVAVDLMCKCATRALFSIRLRSVHVRWNYFFLFHMRSVLRNALNVHYSSCAGEVCRAEYNYGKTFIA